MGPGQGGKRKRGERTWSNDSANNNEGPRPSPHRPGTLNMAGHGGNQSNPPRDYQDGRDRSRRQSNRGPGGRNNSRRESYDNQNFSNSQQREPTAMSPPPPTQPKDATENTQPNGETPAAQHTPSPAPNTPVASAQPRPSSRAGSDAVIARPIGPPPPYDYEYVTDSIVDEWFSAGKQKVVEQGSIARRQQDLALLASVYQELIRSAIYSRLSPSEAGSTVKDIIAEETGEQDVEMEGEDDKSSSAELDARSVFLDTLSIVTDADTSNPALKPLVFATEIDPSLMRIQLETPLLQSLGLVRDTFARMGIRKQTNLLYRQSNYNLLREESEGYSKLLTELFTTSNNEPPSSEVVEDTFERVKAMIGAFDMDVGRVLDVTLDVFAAVLVKQYRFFVKLLRASSWWPKEDPLYTVEGVRRASGLPNWALPGSPGWITTEEDRASILVMNGQRDREFWDRVKQVGVQAFFELGRKPLSDEEKLQILPEANGLPEEDNATNDWIEETGTLPPKGNRVAAQLLGFKLRFYSSNTRTKSDVLPDNLIYLAALLIKIGFISLRDLYAHLWRPDESMDTLKTEKMAEKAEREKAARPGGGTNALMMAGALSDDTIPPPRIRESESRMATPSKDQDADKQSSKTENGLPEPSDQKVLLLKSLLAIGAIPEALFVMSKFPWLMDGYPELPEFIHRILHHCLSKVYTPLRPLNRQGNFPGDQQILSADQTGLPKGELRLVNPPPRRVLRWAQLDKEDDTSDGIDYRFYWDDWADNIPICQSVDDVFALCSSFLNLSGHKIGQDASLLTKLARIGKHSLSTDPSEENRSRWRDMCKRLILPSVSLTKANPGVVNEVFSLISFFSRDVRYNMYAEWYSGQTSRLSDIKGAFDQARAETKDVLKRLSKTNIKPMARALAKIAYANPGIVINVAISQIESYENLIEVVVECARYFTNLGYDILTWSLINSLGHKGRSRVQEGGLLTSRWLNALSTFAGRTFKRYSVMDPTPLLQYVVEQLRTNNSTDLIVLEQLISSMAGIISDNNFNDNQIQAMAGGELLQAQTILQLLDRRHESMTTSKRLITSLTKTRLAGQLLVAIAQERLTCVFKESSAELKLLGNIFDEIHRILTQYLDLLRSNLSIEEFDSFVPDFASLVKEFGVQPEIAFWIRRTSISRRITDSELSKPETALSPKESQPTEDVKMNDSDEGEVSGKPEEAVADSGMDVDANVDKDSTPVPVTTPEPLSMNPVMQELIEDVRSSLPTETWEIVGPHFYATFWQLSLYDVHIPGRSYEDEIERLKRRIVVINNDRSDLSMAGTKRKEQEKKQISQLQEQILVENKSHLVAYDRTRKRLQKEKDRWFDSMRSNYNVLNVALLEQCFIPRLLLSPLDAFFSFKFLKFLHSSGTPNFRTMGFIDQIFREQRLTALIFLCTSKEADNLGRFLNETLRDLGRWHADKAVYEKEAFGTKRDLPGFAKSIDVHGVPTIFLDFEEFRHLLYKWHRFLLGALKTCLNGGEYMHIRNAISVQKAVVQNFPAVCFMGTELTDCVTTLSKSDERDDVKIPAASLIGDLNKRAKKWLLPNEFALLKGDFPGQKKPGSQAPGNVPTPAQLNASAPEFKPTASDSAKSNQDQSGKPEVEDGEIEDAKMMEAGSAMETGDGQQSQKPQADSSKDSASTAMDTTADSERPSSEHRGPADAQGRSQSGTRALPGDIPKRLDSERINPREQARRPRISEGRLPPRSDIPDDRRDRHPDFNPRTRHAGPEHPRSFDGPPGDMRAHGRPPSRDRDFPMRPLPEDPMRGPPYRDARLPREPDWPMDRSGRMRPSDSFHGRDHPMRAELMPEYHDRPADGPRRGEPVRPDKDDRRQYPLRGPSPPRSELPNRPERFPNDRRSGNFGQQPPPRIDDLPRGPRSDRPAADSREPAKGPDMDHGRLQPPNDIPSGPRASRRSNARNASAAQPPPSSSNGNQPAPERPAQSSSRRQSGRGASEQTPPAAPAPSGIHPDRLNLLQEPSSQPPANAPAAPAPPSGPRGGNNAQSGSRGSGNERGRSDKRFAGINNMLQQTNGPPERANVAATPPSRGKGSNRQSNTGNSSPRVSNRSGAGPAAPEEDSNSARSRPAGRTGDLMDDLPAEGRGSSRNRNNDRDRDREGGHRDRRGDDSANNTGGGGGGGGGNSRRERRDRDRARRSDVGGGSGGSGRDEKERDRERPAESRESQRRNPGSREEARRRDRRERDDGPPESSGPAPSSAPHEGEGRPRPSSSMGAPPPPPPPPPPLPSDDNNNPRRWSSGGDRGNDRGNRNEGGRDRERERRGDRGRDRDHRESGGGSSHRKRGRPNQDDNSGGGGDGGQRGQRMGNDNKRPRRGQ